MKWLSQLSPAKIVVICLLLAAAFLRLYNLEDSLLFQGDQGRDAMIVADIFKEKDPVFIGPVTSVGNMYLGPLYYYFMLPFLWLTYPSPMGPVYAVALLGVLTVALVYILGKKMIGQRAALIATSFYTFSWVVVTYARFSWNPNPAPLVSLLMIYWTYQAYQKKPWFWALVGLAFAVLLQLHYLTLLAAGGAGVVWLFDLARRIKGQKKIKPLILPSLTALAILLLSFTPLILFDYKHHWLNLKAFRNLLFGEPNFKLTGATGPLIKLVKIIKETHGRGMHILFEIALGQWRQINSYLLYSFLGILGWRLWKKKQSQTHVGELVLAAYLLTGIIGTAFYEHTVFDHYVAYLFPVTFLIYGLIWQQLSKKIWGKALLVIFFAAFLRYNLPRMPLKDVGWTLTDMRRVSQSIYDRVQDGEKYNLVLLSESKDINAQNYRYFLETTDRPPVDDRNRDQVQTLFIVDEEKKLEKVVDSPIYEIVVFPNKTPTDVYQVENGPEVTILKKKD